MAKFSKDGHTVETSFAPEIVRLRAEGYLPVSDSVPDPEPATAPALELEPAKQAPAQDQAKPAVKPAK